MKRIVALLVVLGMVVAMLPMKAQAGIIEHEPEISVGLDRSCSNITFVNNYGFDAPLEYDGGMVLYMGSACHLVGKVVGVGVTDIEVSIDKWFPGTYVDGQTSDWQGTQAYYKGTNTPAKVSKHYSTPQSINLNLRGSEFDNNLSFGRLDIGYYRVTVRVKTTESCVAFEDRSYETFAVLPKTNIDFKNFKNVIPYNTSYAIPIEISSTLKIQKIEAKVVWGVQNLPQASYRKGFRKSGPVKATWNNVGARTVSLRGSVIDNNISFAGLSVGDYYFVVTVTRENGTTFEAKRAFSIR